MLDHCRSCVKSRAVRALRCVNLRHFAASSPFGSSPSSESGMSSNAWRKILPKMPRTSNPPSLGCHCRFYYPPLADAGNDCAERFKKTGKVSGDHAPRSFSPAARATTWHTVMSQRAISEVTIIDCGQKLALPSQAFFFLCLAIHPASGVHWSHQCRAQDLAVTLLKVWGVKASMIMQVCAHILRKGGQECVVHGNMSAHVTGCMELCYDPRAIK